MYKNNSVDKGKPQQIKCAKGRKLVNNVLLGHDILQGTRISGKRTVSSFIISCSEDGGTIFLRKIRAYLLRYILWQ
jgi:hypothetical protein